MTIAARLAAYYFAFFSHAGASVSYFALYLAGRGMTAGEIAFAVAMPQAARIAVPPLSNTFISLVKDTSLAAAVTVPELFQAAQRLASVTYEPLILYIETAIIYLMFSSVLSTLQDRLERKLTHKETREVAL